MVSQERVGWEDVSRVEGVTSNHLVSVIIPFLNPGDFLIEAIESVTAQTYPLWELLLVDDGSTDNSTYIARSFAENSGGRIKYLEHPGHGNRGMPASRNVGILNSRGLYIANLDADDTWDEAFLEEFVAVLDSNPSVAMTFGPMKVWFSWSKTQDGYSDWVQPFTFAPNGVIHPPDFVPLLLSGRNDPQGAVFRREVLHDVGLYEESINMCEDWALFVKIALKYSIMPTRNCHYRYRQHPAQFCRQRLNAGTFHQDFLPFLQWLTRYLKSVPCDDRGVWAAVSRLIWRNRFLRARELVLNVVKRALPKKKEVSSAL